MSVSNLGKVLYPDAAFTKGDLVSYYVRVAPTLLAHVRDRPVTLRRYPDGVSGTSFYQKHVSGDAPTWVRTVDVARRSTGDGAKVRYVLLCDLPSLVWVANLAAIELHVPMWRASGHRVGDRFGPVDLMVFDLDPGPPASVVDCCRVAGWVRQALEDQGDTAFPKTSGAKGLQLYVPLRRGHRWEAVRERAHRIADDVARHHPDQVLTNMRRDLRPGKVLIDWSQNHPAKTTVAPYSLRAQHQPAVSTPVSWDEVAACEESADPASMAFGPSDVLARLAADGDRFAPLLRR